MTHSLIWRKSSERVAQAHNILNTHEMAGMLAVLELDHPAKNRTALKDGFDATYRIGCVDGFEMCLSMLRELGKPAPLPMQHLEATWGSEDQSKQS